MNLFVTGDRHSIQWHRIFACGRLAECPGQQQVCRLDIALSGHQNQFADDRLNVILGNRTNKQLPQLLSMFCGWIATSVGVPRAKPAI